MLAYNYPIASAFLDTSIVTTRPNTSYQHNTRGSLPHQHHPLLQNIQGFNPNLTINPKISNCLPTALRSMPFDNAEFNSHPSENTASDLSNSSPASAIEKISLDDIQSAADRLKGVAVRTPLVQLDGDFGENKIYLKLELLQPNGSFKIRGAGNILKSLTPDMKEKGVWTASAGNMASCVAWYAKQYEIPCHIVVPDDAPAAKLNKISKLGANIIKIPRLDWFHTLKDRSYPGLDGEFVHPFADQRVMAGNAVIAKEILEDLPDVDLIIAPYGGGGLSCGIGAGIQELGSKALVYACEPETAASLAASFAAGEPTPFDAQPSFVDGMGSPFVFEEMWPFAQEYLEGSIVVELDEIASAIKTLHEKHSLVAEGAGAASVAAAMKDEINVAGEGKKIVCIVSGGNIDSSKVIKILNDEVPN